LAFTAFAGVDTKQRPEGILRWHYG
jgi:hypothetical protein